MKINFARLVIGIISLAWSIYILGYAVNNDQRGTAFVMTSIGILTISLAFNNKDGK